MKVHPALAVFPELLEPDIARLALDIREHGLLSPLVRCEGMLLDGRARLVACERAKVKTRFIDYSGDPFAFAMRVNGGRSMTPGQRAIAAGELYLARRVSQDTGGVSQDTPEDAVSAHAIGEALGVSRITVFRAVKLLSSAPVETVDAVRRGETQITVAFRSLSRTTREAKPKRFWREPLAEKLRKEFAELRARTREACKDEIVRKLLEDALQDLSRDLYAFSDGSAYTTEDRA